MVFRSGYAPERIRDSIEHLDLATQVQSLVVTQEAGTTPTLPIGCLGGLIVSLIGGLAHAATGRLLTHFSLTLIDGRIIEAEAEPIVFKMIQKSTRLPSA